MTHESRTAARSLDELVGRLADEFLTRLRNGERPTADEYASRYPEAAECVRQLFPSLEIMGITGADAAIPSPPDDDCRALGDYRLIREIGRGGMGVVYEAHQISLDRRVALKVLPFAAVLDQRQIKRFRNEARAAAQLKHPNIVQVYGVGYERSTHFYAMEYVEGESLAKIIQDLRTMEKAVAGPIPPAGLASSVLTSPVTTAFGSDATKPTRQSQPAGRSSEGSTRSSAYFRNTARIGMQVAEALEHSHQEGIIHRDIKPSNLMLDGGGKVWVTDFGLARIEADAGLTMTGDLLGTLRYMSPEQTLANRVVVDHRTDIYSLGVTLYELLTLRPAFPQEDKHELLRNIAFEDPPRPRRINPHIPAALETIVATAMQKRPADRFYASAQELADDLRRFLDHESLRVRRPGPMRYLLQWGRKRWKWLAVTAAALLLAMLTGLAALAIGYSRVKQLAAELKARNDELEEYNVSNELYWRRMAEGTATAGQASALVIDLIRRGDYAQASETSEKSVIQLVRTLSSHKIPRGSNSAHLAALRSLIDDYEHRRLTQGSAPRYRGARFDHGSFGIIPRLTFDGVPPITIEAIVTCERYNEDRQMQNILACTNLGSIALGTGQDPHFDRYALWISDRPMGGYSHVYAARPIPLGVKQHVCAVWDGPEARLYVDGQLQATQPIDADEVRRGLTGTPFMLGADPFLTPLAHEHFLGVIEAVRYSRAAAYRGQAFDPPEHLEPGEGVIALYDFRYEDGSFVYDRSGNQYHAMLVNVARE